VLLDVAADRRADASLDEQARALAGPDRALCQEIAFGALRWRLLLDARLDALLRRGLGSLPLTVRSILEVAAYQLLFLDRVPARAAIHDAVEGVRALLPPEQARGLTGVVNATLRALADGRGGDGASAPRPGEAAPGAAAADLAVAFSHPVWLVERWLARFGEARTRAILAGDNRVPRLHLRPHAGRITAEQLVERLAAEGAAASLHPLHPGAVVLEGRDPTALAAWREGLFTVQDVAAQLVSRIVPEDGAGLYVDVCAAPGGKIGAAAERPGARTFVAADVSRARLARLAANVRRQGLPIHVVAADARDLALARPAAFVLADLPCLGTGTLRRRVDARWRATPEALPRLVELQAAILANAAGLLAPGGCLLHSTCSLEPEENEHGVERLLADRPELSPVDLGGRVPDALAVPLPGRAERALFVTPEAGDCDGAFAALLRRAA
jgi:16S rRNA (cytosine967-C5)-methyltransferase